MTAQVTDQFGNTSATATQTFTVDETAPTVTINTLAGDNVLNALEAQSNLTIGGSASGVEDGQHVTVTFNNHSYDAVVTSNAWTTTVAASALTHAMLPDGSYTVTANVSDAAGNPATSATRTMKVDETAPVIAVPGAQTLGVGQAAAIAGVSLTESGNTSGETFTATLTDANGELSATGTGVTGSGTTSLTITGSLSQVNSDLATLSDTDATAGSDTITLHATDGFNNSATAQTIAVTVNGLPVIAVPGAQTLGVGQAAAIAGVSLSETGNTSGETFTVTLTDTNGELSASGTGVTGSGTTSLTITGSLSQVNSDLATLSDTDATAGSDTITLHATDGFNNIATAQTIAVTVNGPPVIAVPGAQTLGVGQAAAIAGVSLSESGNTSGETFTVTLADTNGELSASGTGVTGSGTTSLTITGSLSQVNSDLATLSDTDATAGSDTITLHATDSFNNSATAQTIAVTVNEPQNLLVNGGFETGNFSGWTLSGNTGFTGVANPPSGAQPLSGSYAAWLGPVGRSWISRRRYSHCCGDTLYDPLLAGVFGGKDNDFSVTWGGGSPLMSLVNEHPFGYTEYTFLMLWQIPQILVLEFNFRQDPSDSVLDNVSVVDPPDGDISSSITDILPPENQAEAVHFYLLYEPRRPARG